MTTKNLLHRLRIKGTYRGRTWPVFLLGSALALSGNLAAAPGELSQTPLFLTTGVQPNIFLLLDDSGSMDFEIVRSDGTPVDPSDGLLNFTPDENDVEENLRLCSTYNVLAYDPDFEYSAWSGLDLDGNPFQEYQDPRAAQVNPYTGSGGGSLCESQGEVRNGNGETCDLLAGGDFGSDGAFYYVWDEQAGECGRRVYVENLVPGDQKNYANWFSYYRKRQYVLKRALSQVVANSQARVGMATINQGDHVTEGDPVGTPVKDLKDAANKETLLDNLLGIAIDSSSITPLRIGLKRTGDYFSDGVQPLRDLFGFKPEEDPDSASGHSPILKSTLGGECQQNFALVVSDGFWNGPEDPQVDNADGPRPDGDAASIYDGQSYADDFSDTLADVAMHFYETDLIDALADKVPATNILAGSDDNPAQHLVTFTVAFGTNGTLTEDPTNREAPFAWPQPSRNAPTTVDDMRHAAWNGRGLFLSAKAPQELTDELDAAIGDIGSRTATSAAAVAVNSTSLRSGSLVYQAGFDSLLWSGTLSAFELTGSGLGATPKWKAHEKLNRRNLVTDPRIMISFNGSSGISFQFPTDYRNPDADAELSAEQINDLLADAPFPGTSDSAEISANQAFGEALVGYFRLRENEGTTLSNFRERGGRLPDQPGGLLADIIDSAPVFVGAPDPTLYPDDIEPASSYQAWANGSAKDRTEMVYVGTNGGTLHGFVAEIDPPEKAGREVFAYFPQLIFSDANDAGLHLLARQNYRHRYYVDNTPTVAEVFIDTGDGGGARWRTILVGSLRGGGKGLFALDVSDPDSLGDQAIAAGKVLWEFTDADLGFTFSRPTLAKLNGVDGNGKWAAIFGNGYNSDPDGDGAAKLFILYLDGTNLGNPIILDTKSGSMANNDCRDVASDCNGLATPAVVDLGGDGIADRVYAGDLKGNLWVFDLSDTLATNWVPAYGSAADPKPLFTAQVQDSDGVFQPQPITAQPAVTLHLTERSAATEPNTLVFFGTGQFIVANDTQTTEVQSFYGLWDSGTPIAGGRTDLQSQTIDQSQLTIGPDTFDIRTLSSNPVDYQPQKGWYVDFLIESGERVVVNPLLFGELVVYTTLIPSGNECGVAGNSWLMVHDFFTGGEPNFIALDLNNNGSWEEEELTGVTVAGVSTGDLFWQPTIVQSGVGAEGTVLLPKDTYGSKKDTLETQRIRGGSNRPVRSSWARFEFD